MGNNKKKEGTIKKNEGKKRSAEQSSSSTLSVIAQSGLTATTSTASRKADSVASAAGGPIYKINRSAPEQSVGTANTAQSATSESSAALDFISTGKAVKALFSIPYSEHDASFAAQQKQVYLAVHNFEGTLIIDQAVDEEQYFSEDKSDIASSVDNENASALLLPPSCESLALALTTQNTPPNSEALSLLSSIVAQSKDSNASSHTENPDLMAPPMAPREYVEWEFQGMNLLVGSDALIVRPSGPSTSHDSGDTSALPSPSAVAVRVEEVSYLRNAWQAFQLKQQMLLQEAQASQRSYAQALKHTPKILPKDTTVSESKEDGFSEVPLQTCVVPFSGPLGGRMLLGRSQALVGSSNTSPLNAGESSPPDSTTVPSSTPALSIVLDAYLDNLMANVPQLALCLQEKGLVQSVKFLQTNEIPSMMIHPSTLEATASADPFLRSKSSADHATNDMFSPQIMEMNASALLRFLKANCTRNNTTYLLRHDPVNTKGNNPQLKQHNIQLYDISSLSTQGQKKWIWWLATMSYRFALRLRHLETSSSTTSATSVSEAQRRAIRDRERSLLQQTLDLLQDLMDMDGNAHESLVASVREHMADTYLAPSHIEMNEHVPASMKNGSKSQQRPSAVAAVIPGSIPSPSIDAQSSNVPIPKQASFEVPVENHGLHPYACASVDALNKAQDHLSHGMKALLPLLEPFFENEIKPEAKLTSRCRRRKRPGDKEQSMPFEKDETATSGASPAIVMQMLGLNYKLVNVSLRLAEHHLKNYYSSSAMQALRTSARRLVEAVRLLRFYMDGSGRTADRTQFNASKKEVSLQLQYVWLLEHCGHFARSFASDENWRIQGHASGEDVIFVLRDVESAFTNGMALGKCNSSCGKVDVEFSFSSTVESDGLFQKSKGRVSLQSLAGVLPPPHMNVIDGIKATKASEEFLGKERVLQREKRRVLVASCVCYSRAITALRNLVDRQLQSTVIINLLEQRRGDAYNETGKAVLKALQASLVERQQGKVDNYSEVVAETLLHSAQFWFTGGLESFEMCKDARNAALVRCNFCQSFKFKANALFAQGKNTAIHAEDCLQSAADELIKAHEDLIQRDKDPGVWDMVSEELASTFLVLGTRRRQSFLGGVSNVLFQVKRLSPGEERSIIDPMERALKVYEQSGNLYQAAATHYQLALTFSKMWTCQSNESNARKKLSMAFENYSNAFGYFSKHLAGNESTFCLLCLDLASLYATLIGEEGLVKALGCCLDCCPAFSMVSCKAALANLTIRDKWFETMNTLSGSVEERVFTLLKGLVKLDQEKYKELYRAALSAKMVRNVPDDEELCATKLVAPLIALHEILMAVKEKYDHVPKK